MNDTSQKHSVIDKHRLCTYRVVKHFGGMTATARLLTAYGKPTPIKTVGQWRRRRRIPMETLVMLALIARDKGMRFDLYDFLTEKECKSLLTDSTRTTPAAISGGCPGHFPVLRSSGNWLKGTIARPFSSPATGIS